MIALAATTPAVSAFVPSGRRGIAPLRSTVAVPTQRKAATLDETSTVPNGEATTWDCNDEAECVVVPACDEEGCRTSLDVRIHGEF